MRNAARRGLVAGAVVLAFLGTLAVQSTVAAWTDSAHVSATASAGSWAQCTVWRDVNGVPTAQPGKSCAVTSIVSRDFGDGAQVGSRRAWVTFSFSHNGAEWPDYFRFTVDLTTATGLPAGFNWGTGGPSTGNLLVLSECTAMPYLTAETQHSWGPQPSAEQLFYENRSGRTDLSCT